MPLSAEQQALVVAHIEVARTAAAMARRKFHSSTYDELLSSAYYAVCKAALTYDPSKGPFGRYARMTADHQIIQDRLDNRQIRVPRFLFAARGKGSRFQIDAHRAVEIGALASDVVDHEAGLALSIIIEHESLEILWKAIGDLSVRQQQVIVARLRGFLVAQIARDLGISEFLVQRAYRLGIELLKLAMD